MSTNVKIQIIEKSVENEPEDLFVPKKAHPDDAAFDIFSRVNVSIAPGQTALVPTGFKMQLEKNFEAQIRPRSGNALKKSLQIANSPGTIDSNYRGEVGVIVYNAGSVILSISRGDKIAQMVIQELPVVNLVMSDSLDESDRGENGFGSTGLTGEKR